MVIFKKYFALAAVLVLSSCAYAIDGSIQDVTFVTPGAHGARCDVYANNFHFRVNPPETISLPRSKEDLRINCLAPGNREREVIIETAISNTSRWNALNGVLPGTLWDRASGALFAYPSYIEIDFRHIEVKPGPMPAHDNPDIKQLDNRRLEEFSHSSPRLNSDRAVEVPPLIKTQRGRGVDVLNPSINYNSLESEPAPDYSGSKSSPIPLTGNY